jgi:hypothetical protein
MMQMKNAVFRRRFDPNRSQTALDKLLSTTHSAQPGGALMCSHDHCLPARLSIKQALAWGEGALSAAFVSAREWW